MNKLVVGVSGGPDSMMLLDLLRSKGYQLIVAHVNYQKRPEAFFDEELVNRYCQKYNLPFHCLYPANITQGNFQRQAREVRYRFFADLVKTFNYQAIAVAHQLNDLVETYLLQKKRGGIVNYFGLQSETVIAGVRVIRPLLVYSRQEVLAYCADRQLEYALDSSNDTDSYSRNVLRTTLVSKLTKPQLLDYQKQADQANEVQAANLSRLDRKLAFSANTVENQRYLLVELLKNHGYYYFRRVHLDDILTRLATHGQYRYRDRFILSSGAELEFIDLQVMTYSFCFQKYQAFDHPCFRLRDQGEKIWGLAVKPEDWPLTIRNWQAGDKIALSYGHKKVSRLFIDKKIAEIKRYGWPVVLNCSGEVLAVAGLATEKAHFSDKPDIYVIK